MEDNYEIGDVVDTIVDKNGKEWHIIKVGENAYQFKEYLETPFTFYPWEPIDEWLNENMTEEQKKKWGVTPERKPGKQPIKEKPTDDITDRLFVS